MEQASEPTAARDCGRPPSLEWLGAHGFPPSLEWLEADGLLRDARREEGAAETQATGGTHGWLRPPTPRGPDWLPRHAALPPEGAGEATAQAAALSAPRAGRLLGGLAWSCVAVLALGVCAAALASTLVAPRAEDSARAGAPWQRRVLERQQQQQLLDQLQRQLAIAKDQGVAVQKKALLYRTVQDQVVDLQRSTAACAGGPAGPCPRCPAAAGHAGLPAAVPQAHGGEPGVAQRLREGEPCSSCSCGPAPEVRRKPPPRPRKAFVMMAHDPPGSQDMLMGVLAMARALQKMSSYPLVVLTNTTNFLDGTRVADGLRRLNAEVLPLHAVDLPKAVEDSLEHRRWKIAWWKLQIWNLTQYERLIWMDSDAILYRSIDWLFDRPWMWAQRDDRTCVQNVPKLCTGILLLEPNRSDYLGLISYASELQDLRGGDQQLIGAYFGDVRGRPIHPLADVEAAYGHCLGKATPAYRDPDKTPVVGTWDTPAFVHRSGGLGDGGNACFEPRVERQVYEVGELAVNMCHLHPLGAHWRQLLCEAVALLALRVPQIAAFCDDRCWFLGKASSGGSACVPPSRSMH